MRRGRSRIVIAIASVVAARAHAAHVLAIIDGGHPDGLSGLWLIGLGAAGLDRRSHSNASRYRSERGRAVGRSPRNGRHRRRVRSTPRFRATDERFVDPTTSSGSGCGSIPRTGERRYRLDE